MDTQHHELAEKKLPATNVKENKMEGGRKLCHFLNTERMEPDKRRTLQLLCRDLHSLITDCTLGKKSRPFSTKITLGREVGHVYSVVVVAHTGNKNVVSLGVWKAQLDLCHGVLIMDPGHDGII